MPLRVATLWPKIVHVGPKLLKPPNTEYVDAIANFWRKISVSLSDILLKFENNFPWLWYLQVAIKCSVSPELVFFLNYFSFNLRKTCRKKYKSGYVPVKETQLSWYAVPFWYSPVIFLEINLIIIRTFMVEAWRNHYTNWFRKQAEVEQFNFFFFEEGTVILKKPAWSSKTLLECDFAKLTRTREL